MDHRQPKEVMDDIEYASTYEGHDSYPHESARTAQGLEDSQPCCCSQHIGEDEEPEDGRQERLVLVRTSSSGCFLLSHQHVIDS